MSQKIIDLSRPAGLSSAAPDPRTTNPLVEQAWRERMIREAAYFRSLQRQACRLGEQEGGEQEDWLAAEREIDRALYRWCE